jgi:O-antigen/teichoic acid export membrane protein
MAGKTQGLGAKAAGTIYPLFVGSAIGVLLAAFKIIIATRLLGPALFGIYVFVVSYYTLIGSINDFGISSYFKKRVAELNYKKDGRGMQRTLSAGFALGAAVSLTLALVGIFFSGYAAAVFGSSVGATQNLLEIGSLVLFTTIMFAIVSNVLIGLGHGKDYSVSYLTYVAIDFSITVYALLNGYGVIGILIGTLVGGVAGIFIALFYINKSLSYMDFCPWYPKMPDIKEIFDFSYPLAAYNFFAGSMQNFSVIFLGFFVSGTVIGNYGTALKGLFVLSVFYGSVVTVLLPTFSEAAKRNLGKAYNEGVFNSSLVYAVFVTFPVLLYFAVFSKPLIYLFVGVAYSLAPLYLTLMALGTVLSILGFLSGSMLIARGYTRKILKYGALSSLLQLFSIIMLVKYLGFGVIGAIASIFFVGSLANSIFFVFAVSRILKMRINMGKLARMFSANLAFLLSMAAVTYLIGSFGVEIIAGAALLVILYPAIVMLFGAMNLDEVAYFKRSTESLAFAGPLIAMVCEYMTAVGKRVSY